MTGYGKASFVSGGIFYLFEIHAVNRKNLDISIFLPREMLSLDIELRKWIGEFVKRGQVTLKLTKETQQENLDFCIPDLATLQALKRSWSHLAERLGVDQKEISLKFLVEEIEKIPRFQKKDQEEFELKLRKAFEEALHFFLEMKEKEGEVLGCEIMKYLEMIKQELVNISQYSKEVTEESRKRLESRFKEFDLLNAEGQERIAREVVLYADKGDLTEEVERLFAHIKSFEEKIRLEGAVGKILDFIILEMNREANTIASKSQHLKITNIALMIKSEIEKIREQIQNIE